MFCDFGPQFPIIDTNGEQPLTGMIVSIVSRPAVPISLPARPRPLPSAFMLTDTGILGQDEEGIVTTLDETRHGLEDGDYVTFSEVEGMEELNGSEPRKISVKGKVLSSRSATGRPTVYVLVLLPTTDIWLLSATPASGPYTFSIGDVSGLGTYKSGGLFAQVKMPKLLDFVSALDLTPSQSSAGTVPGICSHAASRLTPSLPLSLALLLRNRCGSRCQHPISSSQTLRSLTARPLCTSAFKLFQRSERRPADFRRRGTNRMPCKYWSSQSLSALPVAAPTKSITRSSRS